MTDCCGGSILTQRDIELACGRGWVGPSEISRNVPRWAGIAVTGVDPYDVDIRVNWDEDEQRLVAGDMRITRRPNGPAVRASDVAALKLGQLIGEALIAEVLDDRGAGRGSSKTTPTPNLPSSMR